MLCLFDKNVEKSEVIKTRLGTRLQKIIDIGNEFIVGFGIDFSHRLCSQVPGLLKVVEQKAFLDAMKGFVMAIDKVLEAQKAFEEL